MQVSEPDLRNSKAPHDNKVPRKNNRDQGGEGKRAGFLTSGKGLRIYVSLYASLNLTD